MRRRVSDFIRMHPHKAQPSADQSTPSRRAVSGKIMTIDEEDISDPVLSGDLIQAFKRQRSADKESHSLLLSRLAEAEGAALQAEAMKREIEALKRRLAEETARSEGLLKQLTGRDLYETRQNEMILDLQSQVTTVRAEVVQLKARKATLSERASLPAINKVGLPVLSDSDSRPIPAKLSMPDDIALPRQSKCPDCQRYSEKSKAQETIIQGQQSVNRALMEKVAGWQKVTSDAKSDR